MEELIKTQYKPEWKNEPQKSIYRQPDRVVKIKRPDKAEHLPDGVSMQNLSVKERKKYKWMLPDELKDHPMYDTEHDPKFDYCKMKQDEKEKETKDKEDKDKKESKDKDHKIKSQAKQILDLQNIVSEHNALLAQIVDKIKNI